MINLYLDSASPEAEEMAEQLRKLVVAHRVVEVEPGADVPELGEDAALPAVQEGGRVVSGPDEVRRYLADLERELTQDRRVSGDACYLNPERPWTCL